MTVSATSDSSRGVSEADAAWFARCYRAALMNMESVVRGKTDVLELALSCLLAEGHLLIEDVPGVGKTTIAKVLSTTIGGSWRRIQFTPDLLPSDITGVSIWDPDERKFEFHRGAVFSHLVLADEVNRASPKTQSALLEVMEERQVTVDGVSYPVPRPFLVIATQNPIDLGGTYRLPEAQLDRFLMRISVGYPDGEAEAGIIDERARGGGVPPEIGPVLSVDHVTAMIHLASQVVVHPEVSRYIVALAAATRTLPDVRLGLSTRGALALVRAAQSRALATGRTYVVPQDIKEIAKPVIGHRLLLTAEAEVDGRAVGSLLDELLATVPVPRRG